MKDLFELLYYDFNMGCICQNTYTKQDYEVVSGRIKFNFMKPLKLIYITYNEYEPERFKRILPKALKSK